MNQKPQKPESPNIEVEGEGSYSAAADYRDSVEDFLENESDEIPEKAQAAADALDGDEAAGLAAAEQAGRDKARK